MKAIFLSNARQFGEEPGQVLVEDGCLFITCPNCGARHALKIPPFTFDAAEKSIGPASIQLNAPLCGWGGELYRGEWKSDSPCQSPQRSQCFPRTN